MSTSRFDDFYDYLYKVVLIGDSGVGKSCLMQRFVDDRFKEEFRSTIGVEFNTRTVLLDGERVKLQIWDTAGQERFRSIIRNFYRNARAIIIVYDVTNKNSFDSVSYWLEVAEELGDAGALRLLVGNKADLADYKAIEYIAAKEFVDSLGMDFVETSAKSAENVDDLFLTIAKRLREQDKTAGPQGPRGDFILTEGTTTSRKKCC